MKEIKRLLHLSDLHLNHLPSYFKGLLGRRARAFNADAVVLTGDVTTGRHLRKHLQWVSRAFPGTPVHFVLGNHDFYSVGFSGASRVTREVVAESSNMNWLAQSPPVMLNDTTVLVGEEGWYSNSFGREDALKYSFDWYRIPEFIAYPPEGRIQLFETLSVESTSRLLPKLELAVTMAPHVVVATHVPPFTPASVHSLFKDFWLSYNVNVHMGDMLTEFATENPRTRFTVLAGHTHQPSSFDALPNLTVRVGRSANRCKVSEDHLLHI